MDAADQSAREQKGYGDGLTQALTLVVGAGALRRSSAHFIDCGARHARRSSSRARASFGVLASSVTAYYEYQARIARHDEGKPWARRMR